MHSPYTDLQNGKTFSKNISIAKQSKFRTKQIKMILEKKWARETQKQRAAAFFLKLKIILYQKIIIKLYI